MVKGISRQVIVVDAPEPKLFDQAIFILKDEALGEGVTEDALLREAQQVIRGGGKGKKRRFSAYGLCWALLGAAVTGIAWAVSLYL